MAENSQRPSTSIILGLLAALVVGLTLVAAVSASGAALLLVLAVLAAIALSALSVVVARRAAYLKRNQNFGRTKDGQATAVSTHQWLTLTVGLAVIAALTGVGAGLRMATVGVAGAPIAARTTSVFAPPVLATTPPGPTPTPTSAPSPRISLTPSATDTTVAPLPGTTKYLDSMTPVNGYRTIGPTYLSAKRYPRSIGMDCYSATSQFNEWNVAGSRSFSATVGIADDATDAFGAIAEFIFYDQDGHQLGEPYDVSVGHPLAVNIDLTSIVHLRITCAGRDSKTNHIRNFNAVLGDALIVNS